MTIPKGTLPEQIEHIVNIATRAPSTHNSQPWKFDVQGNTLIVSLDESVVMPKSDPEGRYKHISIGYLLHHLYVVGKYYNMLKSFSITPENESLAVFTFEEFSNEPNRTFELLFLSIQKRQNLRGPFSPEVSLSEVMDCLGNKTIDLPVPVHVECVANAKDVEKVAELTAESMRRVYRDDEFRREMASWIKPNNSKEKRGIHGYSLNQKLLGSIILPHIIRNFNIGAVLAKLNYNAISSAPFVLVYATEKENISSWISVGMRASEATLTLLAAGYNTSIFVAALEHVDTKKELGSLITSSETPQFVMAGGKILVSAPYTPRYTFSEKKV